MNEHIPKSVAQGHHNESASERTPRSPEEIGDELLHIAGALMRVGKDMKSPSGNTPPGENLAEVVARLIDLERIVEEQEG